MTQDRYLGQRLTDRQTAEVLEGLFDHPDERNSVPKRSIDLACNHGLALNLQVRWAPRGSNPEPAD
jgi:hypothetical protein